MAARITAGLALRSALLLVAALAAVTPAQNRFDLSRAATARSAPAASVSASATLPARLAVSSSPAGHVNRFATERIRAAAAPSPVIGAPTSAVATAARPTANATAAAPPAAAVRSNRFSAPAPAATAPAARSASRPASDSTPIRIVTNWGGRSFRISNRAPITAPVQTTRPATAPTGVGSATDGARQASGTSCTPQVDRREEDSVEPRLNYWDRRRWDPWYLCGWYYWEAPCPTPYVDPAWGYPVPEPVPQD